MSDGQAARTPKFLYFDLGKVLVHFSADRMLAQAAATAGVSSEDARSAVFGGDLLRRHELGQLSSRQFYEAFCEFLGKRPSYEVLALAVSDIFALNVSLLPVVAQLRQTGCAMGILSNTGTLHWEHCTGRYRILAEAFGVHALSHRIGAMKPDAAIYCAAAELAGVGPEEIFFVDDIAENVAGARAAGFDAVQFTTTPSLVAELRRRGLRFNY